MLGINHNVLAATYENEILGRSEKSAKKTCGGNRFYGTDKNGRARIKARMKAEDKEKALRRKQYQKYSQKVTEKCLQARERSKTDSDVIVKPDGSRILMLTTHIAGMQTVMSLEISKPTAMHNDVSKDKPGHKGQMSQAAEAYGISSVTAAMDSSGLLH